MLARMCGSVLDSKVSAQSPPCSMKASPRATIASRSASRSISTGTVIGGTLSSTPRTRRAASTSGQSGCCAAGRASASSKRARRSGGSGGSSGRVSTGTSTVQFTPHRLAATRSAAVEGGGAAADGPSAAARGRSACLRGVVQVLRVRSEIRPEQIARQEIVAETGHRVLHAGAGGLVEIDVPRPAAGAARHVTAQSVVFALQEIRERGTGAVDEFRAVVRRFGGIAEAVHLLVAVLVERDALAANDIGERPAVDLVDHRGTDIVVEVLIGLPLRRGQSRLRRPFSIRRIAIVV